MANEVAPAPMRGPVPSSASRPSRSCRSNSSRQGIEKTLRIAAGTHHTRFLADEFDADVVYGAPAPEMRGGAGHDGLSVVPRGTEVVTPLCAPSLAPAVRSACGLYDQMLIESAPPPRGQRAGGS
jgi:hypothetical protein